MTEQEPKENSASGYQLTVTASGSSPAYDLTSLAVFADPMQLTSSLSDMGSRLVTQWPGHFPASCPPPQAHVAEFEAFRLVSTAPPSGDDFVAHSVAGLPFPAEELCRACGLSVYRDLNDAKRARARYKPLKNKLIARGFIKGTDGVVMQTSTPPSHYTWWVATAVPAACFPHVEAE